MKKIKPLLYNFMKDLAPGIQDLNRVVKERIIYNPASCNLRPGVFKGEDMDIDLGVFSLPIDDLSKVDLTKQKQADDLFTLRI